MHLTPSPTQKIVQLKPLLWQSIEHYSRRTLFLDVSLRIREQKKPPKGRSRLEGGLNGSLANNSFLVHKLCHAAVLEFEMVGGHHVELLCRPREELKGFILPPFFC